MCCFSIIILGLFSVGQCNLFRVSNSTFLVAPGDICCTTKTGKGKYLSNWLLIIFWHLVLQQNYLTITLENYATFLWSYYYPPKIFNSNGLLFKKLFYFNWVLDYFDLYNKSVVTNLVHFI